MQWITASHKDTRPPGRIIPDALRFASSRGPAGSRGVPHRTRSETNDCRGRLGRPSRIFAEVLDTVIPLHVHSNYSMLEGTAPVERLVERALNDLRAFCVQPVFSEILDSVQRNHAQTVREAIPRILATRLADVPESVRVSLGHDLRAMLLEYTNDVFRTIRQAYGDTTCACRTDGHEDL